MPTMGSTLDAVSLRSSLPTGRMTMRYQIPTLHVSVPEIVTATSTTPKVSDAVAIAAVTDETAARKGGEAR
jgi:hypothetical protein